MSHGLRQSSVNCSAKQTGDTVTLKCNLLEDLQAKNVLHVQTQGLSFSCPLCPPLGPVGGQEQLQVEAPVQGAVYVTHWLDTGEGWGERRGAAGYFTREMHGSYEFVRKLCLGLNSSLRMPSSSIYEGDAESLELGLNKS